MKNGKYELVIAPEEYPGGKYRGKYCYEHHLVWWKKTGEIVPLGWEIHHVNGDHRDNRFCNLRLLIAKKHRELHGRFLKEKSRIKFACPQCGKAKILKGNSYRVRLKNNKMKKVFCSRNCATKYQHSRVAQLAVALAC